MGKSSGPSAQEMMDMQRTLQNEAFAMQNAATLAKEDRDASRREKERVEELDRRRKAELEKASKMAEEEKREGIILTEAEKGETGVTGSSLVDLNLDSPQIEQPDYAPREEIL